MQNAIASKSAASYVITRDSETGRWYYYASTFPVSSYPVGSSTTCATTSERHTRDMVYDLNEIG